MLLQPASDFGGLMISVAARPGSSGQLDVERPPQEVDIPDGPFWCVFDRCSLDLAWVPADDLVENRRPHDRGATRPGPTWPRWATDSPPSSPSMTPSSTASASSDPMWPEASSSVTTGASQYCAHHFQGSLNWLGIEDDAAVFGGPQGNGVAERFMRTIKEQCLWSRLFEDTDDLRQAVATFIQTYNDGWLIERLGHWTPREAFKEATAQVAA